MIEPHQSFDHQRLWADLLWTPALTFNLFGDLAADIALADRAVHAWWPDTPGTVCDVRFAHSPGRLDLAYLGNLVAFDVAFVLDLGDGTQGIVGVMTAYHDVNKPQPPKPKRLPRYREITDRSRAFGPEALDAVNGTSLVHIWLAHALVLSMLQHRSNAWRWGRFGVVHAAGNSDFADACTRYGALLVDRSTFTCATIEALLDLTSCRRRPSTRFVPATSETETNHDDDARCIVRRLRAGAEAGRVRLRRSVRAHHVFVVVRRPPTGFPNPARPTRAPSTSFGA